MTHNVNIFVRSRLTIVAAALCFSASVASNFPSKKLVASEAELVRVQKIWDAGKHNAFTDLIRWHDAFYCTFREADAHVGGDGKIRVLMSKEGNDWESIALLEENGIDLRDPKLSITPDGRLMIVAGGSVYEGKTLKGRQPRVAFSTDGKEWTPTMRVLTEGEWLWRVTWFDGKAYGISYNAGARKTQAATDAAKETNPVDNEPAEWKLRLVVSSDGIHYDTITHLGVPGHPNETTLRFSPNGEMWAFVRREGGNTMGWIGTSRPPYTDWRWNETKYRLGGPNFIRLPNGDWWASTRKYVEGPKTVIGRMGRNFFEPDLTLPSGGDTSYAGMVWHDRQLWLSYYSSHEGKSGIYLANIRVPQDPISIGNRRELFVDDSLIDRTVGTLDRRLGQPIPREISIVHDAPWEGSGSGYHSVFQDGNLYRLYYKAWHLDVSGGKVKTDSHPLFCCYAESDDGIHWRKPELGLHEFQGSKSNNIVVASGTIGDLKVDSGHPAVFKDDNPDCPPDARYKAFFRSAGPAGLLPFKSPDGIHWSPMSSEPVITAGAFDSQNLAFWDPIRKEYRAFWRTFTGGITTEKIWKPEGIRAIRTATSADFLHWNPHQDLHYTDSPAEHLYTNQVKPYHRAPHILIGFPTRYTDRGWSDSMKALPELEHRQARTAGSPRYGTAVTEGLLMTSRDGVNFDRWNEAFLRPGPEREGTWNYGHQYIAWHVVETKSMLPGSGNELSLYAGESYWTGNSSELRRYTLRLDGFVACHSPMSGGELITKPVTFSGSQLNLNFASSAAGDIRVELQDESGVAIPGFTLSESSELFGDSTERKVTWKGGSDVRALAGKPIRIRFVLRDADLYAFQFN